MSALHLQKKILKKKLEFVRIRNTALNDHAKYFRFKFKFTSL